MNRTLAAQVMTSPVVTVGVHGQAAELAARRRNAHDPRRHRNHPPDLSRKQGEPRFSRTRSGTDQMRTSQARTRKARG